MLYRNSLLTKTVFSFYCTFAVKKEKDKSNGESYLILNNDFIDSMNYKEQKLPYFNWDNIYLFYNFIQESFSKKPELFSGIEHLSYTIFLPKDSKFLTDILTRLLNYEKCAELAIHLLDHGGLYIIPGTVEDSVKSIIDSFENREKTINSGKTKISKKNIKNSEYYYDNRISFYVYGENNDAKKFIYDSFSPIKTSINIFCEIPSVMVLMNKFLDECEDKTITYGEWLKNLEKNETGELKNGLCKTLFTGFTLNNNSTIVSKIFSPGYTDFSYGFRGDIDKTPGNSPFYAFWNNISNKKEGKTIRKYFNNFNIENIVMLSENMDKVSASPLEYSNKTQNNVQNTVYMEQVGSYLQSVKENRISSIITEIDVINSHGFFNNRINIAKQKLKENGVEQKEIKIFNDTARKILQKSRSPLFYRNMSLILNYMSVKDVSNVDLYDFLIITAALKNPSSFFAQSKSSHIVKIFQTSYKITNNTRKITHILHQLAQVDLKPRIGLKEWKELLTIAKDTDSLNNNTNIELILSTIINKERKETKPLPELKNLNLII